jgi:serine/threonine-protein kinase
VKVTDFGIARAGSTTVTAVTRTGSIMGTAAYLSPEQARGEPATAASDLYALGAVAFELLTGRPPFVAEAPVAVAYQHVRQDPVAPSSLQPSVPPALDAVVLDLLAKDPADRPSAEGLVTRLEAMDLPAASPEGSAVATTRQIRPIRTAALPVVAAASVEPAPRPVPAPRTRAPARAARPPAAAWTKVVAVVLGAVAAVVIVAAIVATVQGLGSARPAGPSSPAVVVTTPPGPPSPPAKPHDGHGKGHGHHGHGGGGNGD